MATTRDAFARRDARRDDVRVRMMMMMMMAASRRRDDDGDDARTTRKCEMKTMG